METYSAVKEEYLKIIGDYKDQDGFVATGIVAKKMGLTNASITEMFQKLSKENLVVYMPYKGVKLTKKGKQRIQYLQRKQDLISQFLENHLECSKEEVTELLDKLEHINHEVFFDKLEEYLKNHYLRK